MLWILPSVRGTCSPREFQVTCWKVLQRIPCEFHVWPVDDYRVTDMECYICNGFRWMFYRLKVVLCCFTPGSGSMAFDAYAAYAQLGTITRVHARTHHVDPKAVKWRSQALWNLGVQWGYVVSIPPSFILNRKGSRWGSWHVVTLKLQPISHLRPGSCGWRFLHRRMPPSLLHVSRGSIQEAYRKPAEAPGRCQAIPRGSAPQGQRSTGSKFYRVDLSVRLLWQSSTWRPPEPTRADCQSW